jgi:hypothetical protein
METYTNDSNAFVQCDHHALVILSDSEESWHPTRDSSLSLRMTLGGRFDSTCLI